MSSSATSTDGSGVIGPPSESPAPARTLPVGHSRISVDNAIDAIMRLPLSDEYILGVCELSSRMALTVPLSLIEPKIRKAFLGECLRRCRQREFIEKIVLFAHVHDLGFSFERLHQFAVMLVVNRVLYNLVSQPDNQISK